MSDVQLGLDPGYGAGDFKAVMKPDPPKPADRAAHFIVPILFPVDLVLLLCAGGFAALLSVMLGAPARVPVQIIPLLAFVPVLYMAADLIEDILFAWLLTRPNPDAIPENVVGIARMATIAKALSVWARRLPAFGADCHGGLCPPSVVTAAKRPQALASLP